MPAFQPLAGVEPRSGHQHEETDVAEAPTQAVPACLLAWLLPGAGHFYLRRRGRALVFLGTITALFVLGVAMQARLEINQGLEDPLALLFGVAQMAAGAPYFLA